MKERSKAIFAEWTARVAPQREEVAPGAGMVSILPSRKMYDRIPATNTAAATRNGRRNDRELPTRYPVITGASIAGKFATKFIIPATRAVLPGGAMRAGIDHPTGADAPSPQSATEIQKIAICGSLVRVAPATASASTNPPTRMVRRTRFESWPERIR